VAPNNGVTVISGEKNLVAWNGSDFVKVASSLVNLTTDVTGTLPVVNGGTGVTTSTGTGNVVLSTSPTLVTPVLGTPTSGTLTNATGLPISTGVSGLGTGIATFLATPSSANLAAALTDETGSGANVFATSPTLVTPILGTPTSATLTNATGLPLSTGVTGTLPVANGGTGTATPSIVAGTNVTVTGTWPNQTIAASGGGGGTPGGSTTQVQYNNAGAFGGITGATTNGTALTLVAPVLGTPASATLTNATGLPLTTGVTGTLPVANGGTGTTTPNLVAGTNITVTGTWPNQTIASSGGGGALVLLDSQTVTGSVTAVNLDAVSGTYTNYIVTIEGLYSPAATTQSINIRYRCSGTTDTNAVYGETYSQGTGSAWSGGGLGGQTDISLVPTFPNGDTVGRSYYGNLNISTFLNSAGGGYVIRANAYVQNPTSGGGVTYPNIVTGTYAGASGLNSAVTGIQVRLNGASMSGKISLYGLT
jgi:hypothetical protein